MVYEPHRKRQFSMYFQLQRRNANAASFVWFLTELRKEVRNQMVVIWDRLAAHRRTETLFRQLEFPWASFEYLRLLSSVESGRACLGHNQVRKAR